MATLEVFVTSNSIKNLLLFLAYLLFVFTAGFKYETGVDWRAYSYMVDDIMSIDYLNTPAGHESVFEGIDVGFNLLISIIKYFHGGLQTLFFILSSVSIAFLVFALKRYLKYPMLGIILYYGLVFFYLDMSGIRQAMALAIFFYSIKFIADRKPLKYLLLLFLAFSFHWSSIFLFPLYFLPAVKLNKSLTIVVLSIAVLVYIAGVKWANTIIPSVFQLLQNTDFATKIVAYSTTEIFAVDRGMTVRTIIHIFFLVVTLVIATKHKERLAKANAYFPIFYRLLILQVLIFFLFYELPELAERIKLYFYLSNIVMLPSFLSLLSNVTKKFIGISCILFYSFFYGNVHLLQKPITIAYFPYQNYIIYKVFDLQSTGEQRLNQHITNMEAQ
jgi:hypothetical protein